MGTLQLIRLSDNKETVLEETSVPDNFSSDGFFCSPTHIETLEKHYAKTGKPKRSYIDVVYITRRQIEREYPE